MSCILYFTLLQLEQEFDLITGEPGMFTKAVNDWKTKWVPAIIEYSYTLAGKKATTVLAVQKKFEGMLCFGLELKFNLVCMVLPVSGYLCADRMSFTVRCPVMQQNLLHIKLLKLDIALYMRQGQIHERQKLDPCHELSLMLGPLRHFDY